MTPQEIFDKAYSGVMTQGYPSMIQDACAYDDGEGGACAVGHLLSPEERVEWEQRWGGKCVWEIANHFGKYVPEWVRDNCELLEAIQDAHDGQSDRRGAMFKEKFHAEMVRAAEKFDLTRPEYEE